MFEELTTELIKILEGNTLCSCRVIYQKRNLERIKELIDDRLKEAIEARCSE